MKKLYKIFLLISIILTLTSCSLERNRTVIDGKTLIDSSKEIDNLHVEQIKQKYEQKYKRHYQNGLYFQDLTKAKEELNQKYNEYLTDMLDNHLKTQKLHNMKYFIRTYIEIVNEDVKKYSQGQISAKEIFENPKESFMRVEIKLYGFAEKEKINREEKNEEEKTNLEQALSVIQELFKDYYLNQKVEYVNYWHTIYDKEILKKYPIEQLKKEKEIELLLSKETYPLAQLSTIKDYYIINENTENEFYIYGGEYTPDEEFKKRTSEVLKSLKNKYNIDFYELNGGWCAPINNPELFFVKSLGDNDFFLGTMYQYLLNKRIRTILKEEKLTDKIVFLVQVEPENNYHEKKGTSWDKYDFGEGFDEDRFLKEGYIGNIHITFIYLKTPDEEEPDYEAMRTMYSKTEQIIYSKEYEDSGKYIVSGKVMNPKMYFYVYNVDDYGKRVVVDLFDKHQITERTRNVSDLGLAGIWSLMYKTRVETPGFHYLDIFAEKEPYHYFKYGIIYEDYGTVKPAKEDMEFYKEDERDIFKY